MGFILVIFNPVLAIKIVAIVVGPIFVGVNVRSHFKIVKECKGSIYIKRLPDFLKTISHMLLCKMDKEKDSDLRDEKAT